MVLPLLFFLVKVSIGESECDLCLEVYMLNPTEPHNPQILPRLAFQMVFQLQTLINRW